MKYETFAGYLSQNLELPQSVLLTAWESLSRFREDLVLIGGLAISHLTKPRSQGLPGAITLDVDFGINIAASSGQYSSLRETMSAHGFVWTDKRFKKSVNKIDVFIDIVTDNNKNNSGSVIVDDGLSVSLIPGVGRALECYRSIQIIGKTVVGSSTTQIIKVAEVGPMLVLKLNAFGGPTGRRAPKDAHDFLYLAMNYIDGPVASVEKFIFEKENGNLGMVDAIQVLKRDFANLNSTGPMSCAAFRLNNLHLSSDKIADSVQIREQCVTLAKALLG